MAGGENEDDTPSMLMGFAEQQSPFVSASQNARDWTESWVRDWGFCVQCGHSRLARFGNNKPLADFECESCKEQFELKSTKGLLRSKVIDGAYRTKIDRLTSATNPNLLLMTYNAAQRAVTNLIAVPKYYFVPRIIQERPPLAPSARRAGWIGSNILLSEIPQSGKIFIVKDGKPQPRAAVMDQWHTNSFLASTPLDARGWLLEVMRTVEGLGKHAFDISDDYADEARLSAMYPGNRHVREKIRQQLQVLRDHGYLEFVSRGNYRLRRS